MLKRTALMESISSNLHSFLKKTGKNLSIPYKKFLRDSLIGLIRAGQPVVCKMARHLPNQQTRFISRLDRLDQHLVKDSAFDSQVEQTLPELWLPYIREDTPIILYLSDIAKPLAKMMDYLATVRDGSTGQLVNGYWLVESPPAMAELLIRLSQPLPNNADFLGYRLLTGLTEAINACFWLHRDMLRRSLRQNPEV
jgi:hypothetical protein